MYQGCSADDLKRVVYLAGILPTLAGWCLVDSLLPLVISKLTLGDLLLPLGKSELTLGDSLLPLGISDFVLG